MPVPNNERRKVFVSYSHHDNEWLKRLQIHLRDLERRGLVELWDDTKTQPGSDWRKDICDALASACAAVLLVSADFIASDFIAENELPPLLAAAESNGVKILPLILSASLFETIEDLARFQTINPLSKPLVKLSKGEQEEYLVELSKAILHTVRREERNPASSNPLKSRQIFELPLPRNRFFTGRGEILEWVRTEFQSGENVQALSGLGGIGKTQTALEYAYLHREDYKVVLWSKAYSRESITADFAAMAGLLNLPEKNAQDQSQAVGAVKRWLENHDGWLLILDNADEISLAREFLPSSKTGHVLLTTRAHNLGEIAECNDIQKMKPSEGALFLLRRLRKFKKGELLESVSEELRKQAYALSEAVDGLPLALDQAAAFIEETPSSLNEYHTLFQSERRELLKRRGKHADDHHDSVTTTLLLAFKMLADHDPAAADLLRVCAFLEADSIPEEIFKVGAKELGGALLRIAESPLQLKDAIAVACRFSLLRRNPEKQTLNLHRLVQTVLKDEMDDETKRMWAERTVRAMNEVFPDVQAPGWSTCHRLILHAQSLASLIDEYGFDFPEAAMMLSKTGSYLTERRTQYSEARALLFRALAIRESVFGLEHQDVVSSLNRIARLYGKLGKYEDEESFSLRALAISEKSLGEEHPGVADSLQGLVSAYYKQGKYDEAIPLSQRALMIREKAFGDEHIAVAFSLNYHAILYAELGKYAEAELLHQRALAIREKLLGPENTAVAWSLYNLAQLYSHLGRLAEAETRFQRALEIREKSLGPEHPDVASCFCGMAQVCSRLSRYGQAEVLYERALAIYEKTLGNKHPDVAIVIRNYAALLRAMRRDAEAESLESNAAGIRIKT